MKKLLFVTALLFFGMIVSGTLFSDDGGTAAIEQPKLPYAENALEPAMGAKTVNIHYGKHHKAYVDKINVL